MTENSAASRQIRVFLSSTFRDFMEERDLLVKQVFPALRRRAQERGVEIVDVDLRWGITEEESQQGKVIGICLAEIERCRPYFIGMLGERYGWTPQPGDYPEELFEREQLQWIRDHQGGASVTELEILHGVLNDREMAGRAFFYFRDPAWSQVQNEPGFVCDTEEEAQKLADLKQRIRASGFPVAESLADPQAIADQIDADLWALIEELYPELDQADALERDARKHAGYRQSRLGVYLGGEGYIQQLEEWIQAGEPKILITGESGAGKSALIANWLAAHEQAHPGDVVYAHHMGCSNDANAIRPLLARMLDTASRLLLEHQLISEPIQVPKDWWELTAKVVGTLQDLGIWCRKTGHRWIWVLDGMDRLDADDQQALPWLPLLIPEGLSVVISALECQALTILEERHFRTLTIGPLQLTEQEALIERYLERYTKKLEPERRRQILSCRLAASPLFLRVLLEELRQCGRFETLKDQIEGYIRLKPDGSLAVSDLYERVLERLEGDCGIEVVRKVMTALWASRAGLSESELLGITGLAPLQWAPIDLALEQALGRNGNRLVFDHDYLRTAARNRYLSGPQLQHSAFSYLADWYADKDEWSENDAKELPWQLLQAGRLEDLRLFLLKPINLAYLEHYLGANEAFVYWLKAEFEGVPDLDRTVAGAVDAYLEDKEVESDDKIWLASRIASVIDAAGYHREHLFRLRRYLVEAEESKENIDEEVLLDRVSWLARALSESGSFDAAEPLFARCLKGYESLIGGDHPKTLVIVSELGKLQHSSGDYVRAEEYYMRSWQGSKKLHGDDHPSTLVSMGNLGVLCSDNDEHSKAESYYRTALDAQERLLGLEHHDTLTTLGNLGCLLLDTENYEHAETCFIRCLEIKERLLGGKHPDTLITVGNLGALYKKTGDVANAMNFLKRALEGFECVLGPEHPHTMTTAGRLGTLLREIGDYLLAEAYLTRDLEASEKRLGREHPDTLIAVCNLGVLHHETENYELAEASFRRALSVQERVIGPNHSDTNGTRFCLSNLLSDIERYDESIPLRREVLDVAAKLNRHDSLGILNALHLLAEDLYWVDELEESEQCYREALEGRIAALGDDDGASMASRYGLARCLSDQGRYGEAIELRRVELTWCIQQAGRTDAGTLASIEGLAIDLRETGALDEAETLFRELVEARQEVLQPDDFEIGKALCELANTLEEAGKLIAAAAYGQQALNHRLEYEGPDAWWTNKERLDLARVLHKLDRDADALILLDQLERSLAGLEDPDEQDQQLMAEATELRGSIEART